MMATQNRRFLAVLISLALYVLACSLPALLLQTGRTSYDPDKGRTWTGAGYEKLTGVDLLISGVFGLLMFNFAWVANPLLWLSWLLLLLKMYRERLWRRRPQSWSRCKRFY